MEKRIVKEWAQEFVTLKMITEYMYYWIQGTWVLYSADLESNSRRLPLASLDKSPVSQKRNATTEP